MAVRVRVCRVDEVPTGDVRAVAVPGVTWPVLVTRLGDLVVATAGVCPHEDVALGDGHLDGGVIVCPGHGYRFDLRSGACAHDAALCLRRYRVTVVGDDVLVDLI